MSDPYDGVKGGRLRFKGGSVAATSKSIRKNKYKTKNKNKTTTTDDPIDDSTTAATPNNDVGGGGDVYTIDAAKKLKYEQLFPVEAKKFGYDPKSDSKTLEDALDDRVKKKADRYLSASFSFCDICVERKESDRMFNIDGCVHSYCSNCVSKHVAAKIQDNITIVTCPGLNCKAVLERDTCGPVLSKEVLDQWNDALCKELISASPKIYCPFKDCSAMLMNDSEGEVIKESECPFCHRLFCAECQVPWHPGVKCEDYQRLNEDERGRDDLMMRDLAKQKKWSRCPKCKFYVERTEGCPHITCRCKFQFCYGCESEWSLNHGGCRKN
ncbi:IBR domain-containing protein [Cephalotus follicularis]|uniref:RBR-type E3 ubiquitin transferase n=1 Tax=Cephalotus follicularis TaxID=3775 RepID=A0A1Q3B130_CEPFO|nr:IBR domain-containing protein [Cephalotus follicularis]